MRSRYQDKDCLTMGEHFRNNGFYTARVGKIFHMRVPGDIIAGTDGQDVEACWTEKFNAPGMEAHTPGNYSCLNLNIFTTSLKDRQSTKMPHRMFVAVDYEGDGSDQPDYKAASKTIELLQERAKDRQTPFFLACGFVRPHYPSVAPVQYFQRYPHEEMPLPENPAGDLDDMPKLAKGGTRSDTTGIGQWPENQQRMWSAYYATVEFMDEQLGRVMNELDRLGLRESTAVIFTSDHGYHLGEHTFWQKSKLHEEVVRVPLLMSIPGYSPGQTDSLSELVDIYPTLTELLDIPTPEAVQGESLVPVLQNPKARVKTHALSFVGGGVGMRTASHAYMRYKDDTEELYDMNTDPGQFTNLADKATSKPKIESLRSQFDQFVKPLLQKR